MRFRSIIYKISFCVCLNLEQQTSQLNFNNLAILKALPWKFVSYLPGIITFFFLLFPRDLMVEFWIRGGSIVVERFLK